jgi:hypothetical protein
MLHPIRDITDMEENGVRYVSFPRQRGKVGMGFFATGNTPIPAFPRLRGKGLTAPFNVSRVNYKAPH